jgi:hypothetical protein
MASQAYRTREGFVSVRKISAFRAVSNGGMVGDDGIEPPTCPV